MIWGSWKLEYLSELQSSLWFPQTNGSEEFDEGTNPHSFSRISPSVIKADYLTHLSRRIKEFQQSLAIWYNGFIYNLGSSVSRVRKYLPWLYSDTEEGWRILKM